VTDQMTPETQISRGQSPSSGGAGAPPGGATPPSPAGRPGKPWGQWRLALAAVIIAVGIVFLIKAAGWLGGPWDVDQWWALLILIPAVGSLVASWYAYRRTGGHLSWGVFRWVLYGLLFVVLAVVFLLVKDWQKVWPVLVIIVGVGIALGAKRN
jgi:hypothetical protein